MKWTRKGPEVIPLHWTRKQTEFLRACRRHKIYGFIAANRSGKTEVCCAETIGIGASVDALTWPTLPTELVEIKLGPPKLIWCLTISMNKSREKQQRSIWERCPRQWMRPGINWKETSGFYNNACPLTNGTVFRFKSAEQDIREFESDEVDLVWIDETVPLAYVRVCLARLIERRGRVIWSTIPDSQELFDLFVDRKFDPYTTEMLEPEDVGWTHATIHDNPHLPKSEVAKTIRMWGAEAKMRAEGKWTIRGGLIYPQYNEDLHIETTPEPMPREWNPLIEVIDPGDVNPTAVTFAGVDILGVLHVYDEIYERGRTPLEISVLIHLKRWLRRKLIDPERFSHIEQLLERLEDETVEDYQRRERALDAAVKPLVQRFGRCSPAITLLDPSAKAKKPGHPSTQELYQQAGIYTELASNDKEAGRRRVREFLIGAGGEPWVKFGRHCRWHRWEITHYKWVEPKPEYREQYLGDKEKPRDIDDHLMENLYRLILRRPAWRPLDPPQAPVGSPVGNQQALDRKRAAEQRRGHRSPKWEPIS